MQAAFLHLFQNAARYPCVTIPDLHADKMALQLKVGPSPVPYIEWAVEKPLHLRPRLRIYNIEYMHSHASLYER